MSKKFKVLALALTLVMMVGMLAGCGGKDNEDSGQVKEPEQNESKAPEGNAVGELVDGVYNVEYDSYDDHGYKPQMELTVSDSKISEVKYDEVKEDGSLKSEDEDYKATMEKVSGTYPEKAFDELTTKAVDSQTSTVDAVSGATTTSNSFNALLKYATEEMAAKGETGPAQIPAE